MQSAYYTQHIIFFVTIFAIFWFTILQQIALSLCRMQYTYIRIGKTDLSGLGAEPWFVVARYAFAKMNLQGQGEIILAKT